jgi:hypothetical protein
MHVIDTTENWKTGKKKKYIAVTLAVPLTTVASL